MINNVYHADYQTTEENAIALLASQIIIAKEAMVAVILKSEILASV